MVFRGYCSVLVPLGFEVGLVYALVEAALPLGKRDASRALDEDRVFRAPDIVCSVALADLCTMHDDVAHMCPCQRPTPEVLDIPYSLPMVVDGYDLD